MNNEKHLYKTPLLFEQDYNELREAIIIAQNYWGDKRNGTLDWDSYVAFRIDNLNEYSSTLLQRIGKNYQPHQTKKSNFICVSSSASAYNLTHNEISANIEKHQKISELRWNDNLIEYICNH